MAVEELHICLWGENNFSNYTPVLGKNESCAVLVLSESNDKQQIERAFQGSNAEVHQLDWPNLIADGEDFSRLQQKLTELSFRQILINVSSGARSPAMQLYRWGETQGYPVYIVDDQDNCHWLYPSEIPSSQINDLANLQAYFRVHNIRVSGHGLGIRIDDPLRKLVQNWVQDLRRVDPYRYLNKVASSAKPKPAGPVAILDKNWEATDIYTNLQDLADLGLVICEGDTVLFRDEEVRFFVNGGWLELYVYEQVRALKSTIAELQDIRIALELVYEGGSKNEIDVVFLANNQLYIIEVKTSYLSDRIAASNQIVYKLEALSSALGREVRGMVVSLYDIPESTIKRAGLFDIEVVAGTELLSLRSRIKQWIQGAL